MKEKLDMKVQHPCLLSVDDSHEDQLLIVRAVKNFWPYPIRCVGTGNEAIRYLNGEGEFADREEFPYPTTVITDLKMLDGDGFELLHNLKSNPRWSIIPTVVLSGSGDTDDIKKAYQLGASSYLTKPKDYSELKKLMGKLIDYWSECEVPEIDLSGRMVPTESVGKLGERFPSPNRGRTERDV